MNKIQQVSMYHSTESSTYSAFCVHHPELHVLLMYVLSVRSSLKTQSKKSNGKNVSLRYYPSESYVQKKQKKELLGKALLIVEEYS